MDQADHNQHDRYKYTECQVHAFGAETFKQNPACKSPNRRPNAAHGSVEETLSRGTKSLGGVIIGEGDPGNKQERIIK